MGSFSIWHWAIVLGVAIVLFGGGGKLSRLMGDFGRGLREFKSSLEGEKPSKGLGGKDSASKSSASKSSASKSSASKSSGNKEGSDDDDVSAAKAGAKKSKQKRSAKKQS